MGLRGCPRAHAWFPVLPDDDLFSDQSIIDMSRLLDAPAGKFGFVQRRGADFVLSETVAEKLLAYPWPGNVRSCEMLSSGHSL